MTLDRYAPPSRMAGILPWICALVFLMQATLIFRGPERMLDRPLTEDGYYSLTIARNIAHGHGASVDGIHPTNGFQPLFTLLTVPLFWLGGADPIRPLRLLLAVHLLVLAVTAGLVGSITRRAYRATESPNLRVSGLDPGWVAALLYLAGVGTFIQHTNGLETGFYLFLIAVAWRMYQAFPPERPVNAVVLGVTLGLVVLARIDGAILVVIVVLGEMLRRRAVFPALAIGVVAALISSPWWIYNLAGFGSLMPTSGKAQQEILVSYERVERTISAWLADAVPWLYARRGGSWLADAVRVIVLVPIVMMLPSRGRSRAASTHVLERARRFGVYLLAFSIALALYYGVTSWASHFYVRYLAPLLPLATVAAAFAVMRIVGRRSWQVAVLALVLVGSMAFVVVSLHQGRVFGRNAFHSDQLALIERRVPKGEWVAAAQTGTLGYFRERVLNLDGKVNAEAYASRHDIAGYLERQRIEWFCDWPWFVDHYFGPQPGVRGWQLVDQQGEFRLLRRVAR